MPDPHHENLNPNLDPNFWRLVLAQEMKRTAFLLAGALNRMLKRKLSMAFEKWQYEAQEAKRSAYLLAGAINRMLKRKLSMAFEKWQYEAQEMKRAKYAMNGAINRMLKRKLSMAFEKWQYECEMYYTMLRQLKYGASIFRMASQRRAFNQWRAGAATARKEASFKDHRIHTMAWRGLDDEVRY